MYSEYDRAEQIMETFHKDYTHTATPSSKNAILRVEVKPLHEINWYFQVSHGNKKPDIFTGLFLLLSCWAQSSKVLSFADCYDACRRNS